VWDGAETASRGMGQRPIGEVGERAASEEENCGGGGKKGFCGTSAQKWLTRMGMQVNIERLSEKSPLFL